MTGPEAFRAQVDVSRETLERLQNYEMLLEKWNNTINLVASSTMADLWSRHFLDSAQLLDLAAPDARHWVDLGSGGGFPGLVIAILAHERRPDLRLTLIEGDGRKAAFLGTAARTLGLAARILNGRIEDADPQGGDVVSARALAPLPKLLGFARRHLNPGGTAILPKGARADQELTEALATWRFSHQKHASRVDPYGAILVIKGIEIV